MRQVIPGFFLLTFLLCFLGYSLRITAQNVVNNGGYMVVQPGGFVVISGNYINNNDGVSDGKVDLDGTIILGRNWVNAANNTVITDIGTSPMGDVIMNGTVNQYIEGTNPTHFDNLILRNADKILRVTDCEVNGRLTVDAVLNLNTEKLIIDNPSQDAITYISKYILSETTPVDGYGEIQWNLSDQTLSYQVPFGSGLALNNDLNLTLTTRTPGDVGGNITFATYPSDCHNVPLPEYVNNIAWDKEYVADRFWIIEPAFTLTKPSIEILFKYTDNDINPNCNGPLQESMLKAARYSTLMNQWTDMTPDGTDDPATNTLSIKNIGPDNFYAPWALVEGQIDFEMFMSNAFTPNADGLNDGYGPVGFNFETFIAYDYYIYDRWGGKTFHTSDPAIGWNGSYNNDHKICQDGVYVWMIFVTDHYGVERKYKGTVTLLGREK